MTPLTKRQRELLEFIGSEIARAGIAPTLSEIAAHMNLRSLSTVWKHVAALRAKGYLKRARGMSRSLTLIWQTDCCPTCGHPRLPLP